MAKSKKEIIQFIHEFINETGGDYSKWYVGICNNAYDKLFFSHKVKQKGDCWFYIRAFSAKIAREVEDYFVQTLGTDGGGKVQGVNADMVYTYRKVAHTDP